ncbi:MAG TPA: 2-oxoglutarate dehydrogenase complex dihydrolipoyllysine-residue succinyltransferase [Alphaproteobacteria bacterium]|nr:2-oxoglutarate dehydrogenase complex dihydrolipoyllysine-residue succinyltransferase [Alphaproteobacteria bacterium]
MTAQIVVPPMGESVSEATVAKWLKKVGDPVRMDEPLVELETDKVTLEVNATSAGVISEIKVPQGGNVGVGAVLGLIQEGAASVSSPSASATTSAPPAKPIAANAPEPPANRSEQPVRNSSPPGLQAAPVMPAARKMAEDRGLNPYDVPGSGKSGRVTKEDVMNFGNAPTAQASPAPKARPPQPTGSRPRAAEEERVRMTRLRQRIAERLKDAQNTAAMLTTFNEVDMSNVMALRAQHKDSFEKKYGVKLGFMSFFVKACVLALKEIPSVNAEIEGEDLVYKNYYDIGVAVGTPQGLVVPVIRAADTLNFAAIEKTIGDLGKRARDGKLSMDDLTGGTFTITNGGIYGSLMSTPILNPPQSGILGMHAIKERAIVVNGKVEARPMMYLALSYDHRVIDGREAVTFLVRVKECIEDPERLLLGV